VATSWSPLPFTPSSTQYATHSSLFHSAGAQTRPRRSPIIQSAARSRSRAHAEPHFHPATIVAGGAIVFAAALACYTGVWLYHAGWSPSIYIGIEGEPEFTPYVTIKSVWPSGPAERAGLRAHDRILTVDGYPQHALALAPALAHGKPGNVVTIVAQRPGVAEPLSFRVILEAAHPMVRPNFAQSIALIALNSYPLPFLIVGLLVLFLRLDDRNAWLLAMMFAGFKAADVHGKWSLRASVTSSLSLQDVRISADCLLPGSKGLGSPLSCLNQARYGIAWGAIGAAMACYDCALQYAQFRKQFHDMPIAGHQLVQEKLVWMISEITKAQLLALQVGRLKVSDT